MLPAPDNGRSAEARVSRSGSPSPSTVTQVMPGATAWTADTLERATNAPVAPSASRWLGGRTPPGPVAADRLLSRTCERLCRCRRIPSGEVLCSIRSVCLAIGAILTTFDMEILWAWKVAGRPRWASRMLCLSRSQAWKSAALSWKSPPHSDDHRSSFLEHAVTFVQLIRVKVRLVPWITLTLASRSKLMFIMDTYAEARTSSSRASFSCCWC